MEGQQRVGVLAELPEVLREMGQDPATVIAGSGINPDLLRNAENSLSFAELDALLQACVAATGCEHFGLPVGQRSATTSRGLVGRLMRTAPTLKHAILDLCTNQRRYVHGAIAYLAVQHGVAFWGYAVHCPGMRAIDQLGDGAIAAGFNMIRELVSATPEEILMSHRAPGNTGPYRNVFGTTPQFDAQQYAIAFPVSLLDCPVPSADRELRRILERSVAAYWAIEQLSVADTVTRMLRARVIFPDSSLEAVASELSMTPRTLNRRLPAEGKSFRELINEARFEVACQLLGGTRMDITNIAITLGYADPSGFTHAFQRWSGVPPMANPLTGSAGGRGVVGGEGYASLRARKPGLQHSCRSSVPRRC